MHRWALVRLVALALLCTLVVPAHAQSVPPPATDTSAAAGRQRAGADSSDKSGRDRSGRGRAANREAQGFDSADVALVAEGKASLRRLAGKPVRGVSVQTVGTRWKSQVTIHSVKLGEPLSGAVARRAIRELLASGAFADARADARPYQDGVILRIVAMPRRIVASVEATGKPLAAETILATAELGKDAEITEASLERALSRLRGLYRRHGFDNANIKLKTTDTDDPMKVVVKLQIAAGTARTITRRIFVIEPHFDQVVGKLKHDYDVEAGDDLDEDALLEADNAMVELLRKKGFFGAGVKHRIVRQGAATFLYIYLQTGPQFRFRFVGNRKLDNSELLKALELDGGSAKFARFHAGLRDAGITRRFDGALDSWSYDQPDDTAKVAVEVMWRLGNTE